LVIDRIAKTFCALCEYADFSKSAETKPMPATEGIKTTEKNADKKDSHISSTAGTISLESLQYHINIVLPESRDQSVYDAIFKSLRDHLGPRNG
jgi:hypothetical protein